MRASDRAYAILRKEVLEWELPPGTVLAEVEQSLRLGVSRTPLREALGRLVADGLVTQSGRGVVVTDISVDGIRELFELRRALEEVAARLAAMRRDAEVFMELEREFSSISDLLENDDPARHAYYGLVGRFDEAVDVAVANPYLVSALNSVRTHLVRIRRHAKDDPSRLRAAAAEHRAIVQAIVAGDSELAAHATHLHLHNALENILATRSETASGIPGSPATDRAPRSA